MNLADELKRKKLDALSNHALKIAEDVESQLIDHAERGFSEFHIQINDRDDAHMLLDNHFVEELRILLESCKVNIVAKDIKPFMGKAYKLKHLVFSW